MEKGIKKIKELILSDKVEEALDFFSAIDDSSELIMLLSRWQALKKKRIHGIINESELVLECNKIRKSILDYLSAYSSKILKNVNESKDNLVSSMLSVAENYYSSQNFTSALVEFQKIVSLGLDTSDIWYKITYCLLHVNALSRALDICEKALRMYSNPHKFLNIKGVILFRLGYIDRALKNYTKALNLFKESELYFNNCFNAYLKLGKYKEMQILCQNHIEKYPNSSHYYYMQALAFKEQDINYAITRITVAISLNSAHPEYYYQRSIMYAKTAKISDSLRDLDIAYNIIPNTKYLKMKAAIHHDNSAYREALAYYTKTIEANPSDYSLYCSRADVNFKLGFLGDALYDLGIAKKYSVDFYDILNIEKEILKKQSI